MFFRNYSSTFIGIAIFIVVSMSFVHPAFTKDVSLISLYSFNSTRPSLWITGSSSNDSHLAMQTIITKIKKNLNTINQIDMHIGKTPPALNDILSANQSLARLEIMKINEEYQLKLSLYSFRMKDPILTQNYNVKESDLKMTANIISDAITMYLTGKNAFFNSQIIYVAELPDKNGNLKKSLAIVDQDGENMSILETGATNPMTPSYSKMINRISYVDITKKGPNVHLMSLIGEESINLYDIIGSKIGHGIMSPNISPNGESIVFTALNGPFVDIYRFDQDKSKPTRLTRGGVNISCSFSPDGQNILFISDHDNGIYTMKINGKSIRRVSGNTGRYISSSMSPDGKLILFITMLNKEFYIGIIDQTKGTEEIIAKVFSIDGISWSPSGDYIIFSDKAPYDKIRKMHIISRYGEYIRSINLMHNAYDPVWISLN